MWTTPLPANSALPTCIGGGIEYSKQSFKLYAGAECRAPQHSSGMIPSTAAASPSHHRPQAARGRRGGTPISVSVWLQHLATVIQSQNQHPAIPPQPTDPTSPAKLQDLALLGWGKAPMGSGARDSGPCGCMAPLTKYICATSSV
jgi:hypothetical protein